MASLIDLIFKKATPDTPKSPPAAVEPEDIRGAMAADFKDLMQWISRVYEELSEKNRKEAQERFEALEDRINQHYKTGNWAGFQGTITEAYNLFRELQPTDKRSFKKGGHWIYRAWSRVLDAEVWFVCCQKEISKLLQQGIKRGAIYTEAELKELIYLSKPAPEDLKKIHLTKAYFDGVITRFH